MNSTYSNTLHSHNMYNKCKKEATFDALRLRDPEMIPVYAFFYAEPAVVRLNRVDGQLTVAVTRAEYDELCGVADFTDGQGETVDRLRDLWGGVHPRRA